MQRAHTIVLVEFVLYIYDVILTKFHIFWLCHIAH